MSNDVAIDVYSGVRQREEWDDDVARPRLEQVLQALVGRDGCGEAATGVSRVLGCGLLAEEPPECPGVLEVASPRRVSRGQHAHGDARDRRMYARGKSCEPDPEANEKVRHTVLHADAAEHQDHGIQPGGEAEGWHGDMAGDASAMTAKATMSSTITRVSRKVRTLTDAGRRPN